MLDNFRSYHLAVSLYDACKAVEAPAYERDQLLRASLSIVLNLAEGSAKPSAKERRRFYSIAFASLRETQALLAVMKRAPESAEADRLGGYLYRLVRRTVA